MVQVKRSSKVKIYFLDFIFNDSLTLVSTFVVTFSGTGYGKQHEDVSWLSAADPAHVAHTVVLMILGTTESCLLTSPAERETWGFTSTETIKAC